MKPINRYIMYVLIAMFPYFTILFDPILALFWAINLGLGVTLGYTWLIGSLFFAFLHNSIATRDKQSKRTDSI